MFRISGKILLLGLVQFSSWSAGIATPKEAKTVDVNAEVTRKPAVFWRDPVDIRSRNLFFGAGGSEHQPRAPFTFVKEDRGGTNPKFVVRDAHGVLWKVKLGQEARPETVASRFVWAVGYFTAEEYFLKSLTLQEKPHLRRGREWMRSDGSFPNVRLKREEKDEKRLGKWPWRKNETLPRQELNGLRVIMALINNWDLKDENNTVYADKKDGKTVYMVSDLGASFGTPGISWSDQRSKGNLNTYRHSKFITKTTSEYVDFAAPSRPALINLFGIHSFIMRMGLRNIGRHVPRDDAQWMGELLGRLSPAQIRDAFRAGGYSAEQTEGFARTVEWRIAALRQL